MCEGVCPPDYNHRHDKDRIHCACPAVSVSDVIRLAQPGASL